MTIPNIFGANIAQEINSAMGTLLFPVNLFKISTQRNEADPTINDTISTTHQGRGFAETKMNSNISGTVVSVTRKTVSILGASLPDGVVPSPGDKVEIEGETSTIVDNGVARDPAGALFICVVE